MATVAERRKHRRFGVACRLAVELPTGRDIRVRTLNVSDGGAYFVADEVLEVGRQVHVRLTVPRDTANTYFLEQFAARAEIIRCDPSGSERLGAGVAVRFQPSLALDLA